MYEQYTFEIGWDSCIQRTYQFKDFFKYYKNSAVWDKPDSKMWWPTIVSATIQKYVIRIIEKCNSIMNTIMMNTIILVRQTNMLSYYLYVPNSKKNISKEFSNVNIIPPSYPKFPPCCM